MRSLPLRVTVAAGFVALSVLLEAHSNERDAADRVQIVVSVFNRAGAPVQVVLVADHHQVPGDRFSTNRPDTFTQTVPSPKFKPLAGRRRTILRVMV
jgi:hypothetical protein